MMKLTILLLIMSMLLTACFPACALDAGKEEAKDQEIPASFDLRSVDTDGDGVGDRCYVTPGPISESICHLLGLRGHRRRGNQPSGLCVRRRPGGLENAGPV